VRVSAWAFIRVGVRVTVPALIVSLIALRLFA